MESKSTAMLLKSTLNGALHKGNFVWGGAMNICWNTLQSEVIKDKLKLGVKGDLAIKIVENFKNALFTKKDLTEDSYYTKAGYGKATLDLINKQCRQKFPNKTFADIQIELKEKDIISYAYFVKEVQYLNPFAINPTFYFNGSAVKGFKAKDQIHYDNIRVSYYTNNDQFILKLLLKQKDQQLFIMKGFQQSTPQQVISKIQSHQTVSDKLQRSQKFQMPIIDLDIKRQYTQLLNSPILTPNFQDYIIGAMFQNIKFKLDQVGAKVQNQAVMMMALTSVMPSKPKRSFIVNKPFWVIMKQKNCHPYFVAQFNNTQFMKK